MKSGNKLNKALKDALDGNPAPLNESQWARIESELSGKRRKPFGFWLLLLVPMLMALGIAYYSGLNKGREEVGSVQGNSNSPEQLIQSNTSDKTGRETKNGNPEQELNIADGKLNPAIQADKTPGNKPGSNETADSKSGSEPEPDFAANEESGQDKFKSGNLNDAEEEPNNANSPEVADPMAGVPDLYPGVYSAISQPGLKAVIIETEQLQKVNADTRESNELLRKTLAGKDKPHIDPPAKRFAIGFASGFSIVNTEVTALTNEKKLHKDTRSLFEQSTRNQNSMFANVIFEWMPFKAFTLGIHSGIQYRSVSNRMDIDYKLNQIPFRDMEGNISFYVPIHDTLNPPTISVRNNTSFRFVNIPLCLNYSFMQGVRNEFRLSAGLNFSLLAGSSGNTFSLNEAGVRPVGEMISNIFDMGYTGGLMYSRNIYRQIWLGTEIQMQNNHLNYDMDYGILKSRLRAYNINLNIRYKF